MLDRIPCNSEVLYCADQSMPVDPTRCACTACGNTLQSTGGYRTSETCSLLKKRDTLLMNINDRALFRIRSVANFMICLTVRALKKQSIEDRCPHVPSPRDACE